MRQNMRAQGDLVFVDWLLKLGTGSLPMVVPGDPNMVEIPQYMLLRVPSPALNHNNEMPVELKTMIQRVFGEDINALTREQLRSRTILTTNLNEVMKINNHLIYSTVM